MALWGLRRPANHTNIVILTGAGISRESGLETFRDKDGIWSKVSIEDVATPRAFARDPARVHAFYNERRRKLLAPEIQPNAAHLALAKLERLWPNGLLIITQNIDNLHERAGSVNIVHMHGQLLEALCASCQNVTSCCEDLSIETCCPICKKRGKMRPNVVWFGEDVRMPGAASKALSSCSLFLAIGTSGTVYPAAAFVENARLANAHTIEFNLEPSEVSSSFDEVIEGPASQTVPEYVEGLLNLKRD